MKMVNFWFLQSIYFKDDDEDDFEGALDDDGKC